MSSKCDITSISSQMAESQIDYSNYVIKAGARAFQKVFDENEVHVATTVTASDDLEAGLKVYPAAN